VKATAAAATGGGGGGGDSGGAGVGAGGGAGAAAAAVGGDASHVLLLLGLPPSLTERALEHHFVRCAPLQLARLHDWSSGAPRSAACLALGSARAVQLAHAPEMASVGGVRIRVCGPSEAAADELGSFGSSASTAMRGLVGGMVERLTACAGASVTAEPSVRHLLLSFSTHASATAAVDDFCATARSGALKNPMGLLMQTLLRHRRLSGGDVWKGVLNGLPLPRAPAERMHALLARLDWSSMPADGKLRGNMAEQSFKLGLSTKEWGKSNGPYVPFAFKAGTGMWDAGSVTRRHRDLWEAAGELIRAVDASFPWTSVQFNVRAPRAHPHSHRERDCRASSPLKRSATPQPSRRVPSAAPSPRHMLVS
jgi:hypothetical protein